MPAKYIVFSLNLRFGWAKIQINLKEFPYLTIIFVPLPQIIDMMKNLLIAICLLAGLTSCHHDDDDEPVDNRDRRTVLVYIAAENNLSTYANSDLDEMKEGSKKLADDQNLIVYVDEAGSLTTPYIARVKGGELVDTVYMKEKLAADPTTLQYIIQYTREKYPAKSYGLMLWGHASGWLVSNKDSISPSYSRDSKIPQKAYGGSSGDNSSTTRYWMNIAPMAKAIANGMGNTTLKFIFGDCCNFGCTEVAYELRSVAEYVIGSPAEIPDSGGLYELLVGDMFLESDNFYQNIIDDYYDSYIDLIKEYPNVYFNITPGDLEGYSLPLAAYKCSELDNLAIATNRLLGTITDKLNSPSTLNLEGTVFYGMTGGNRYSYDIKSVLKKNTAAGDFEAWLTALNRAVIYYRWSSKWLTSTRALANQMKNNDNCDDDCVSASMFFPSDAYKNTNPNWNSAIQQFQWNDVIHWEQYGW